MSERLFPVRRSRPPVAVDPDETLAELQGIVERADRLKAKVDRIPGMASGRFLEMRDELAKFIDATLRSGTRRRRSHERELDAVAARIADIQKAEPIAPRSFRVVERALLLLKRRDIGRAQALLRRLDRVLEPYREWREAEDTYEAGRRRLDREARDLRERERSLAAIPRPSRTTKEVEGWHGAIRELNARIEARLSWHLSNYPSRLAIPVLRRLCVSTRLGLPRAHERASRDLEAILSEGPAREAFGDRGVRALVGATTMSGAKLTRILGDAKPLRRALGENVRWLKAMANVETFLAVFDPERAAEEVRVRVASTRDFFEELGGSGDVLDALRKTAESVESGVWSANQEASRLYRTHGELAKRARDRSLEREIEEVRGMAERLEDALRRLPAR